MVREPTVAPAAFLALMLGVASAQAAPEPFRVGGLARDGALAIREAPDADSPPVEQIPADRRVLGFGCTADTPSGNTWCRVKYGRARRLGAAALPVSRLTPPRSRHRAEP